MDRFEELFRMQAALNDRIFAKQNLTTTEGAPLTTGHLFQTGTDEAPKGPNGDTAVWLRRLLTALEAESRELGEELPWKWWSKDSLDMQNIRVEIVDLLHFWISLALTAGMDAAEVHRLYCLKNQVNLERQEQGYSAATKTGDDNLRVV